jgi:hypothetical protein
VPNRPPEPRRDPANRPAGYRERRKYLGPGAEPRFLPGRAEVERTDGHSSVKGAFTLRDWWRARVGGLVYVRFVAQFAGGRSGCRPWTPGRAVPR